MSLATVVVGVKLINSSNSSGGGGQRPNLPMPSLRSSGHRLGATQMVTATRAAGGGWLSAEQQAAYCRDGFLLVSNLVDPDVCAAATSAMWAQMAVENRDCAGGTGPMLPAQPGMNKRDVPASWTGDGDWPVAQNAAVMAVYAPALLQAAQLLSNAYAKSSDIHRAVKLEPPARATAINRFPRWRGGWREPDEGPWADNAHHIRPNGYNPHSDYGWRPASDRHPATLSR